MHAYIYDAVRTPRGKARADGGLAGLKPQANDCASSASTAISDGTASAKARRP